MRNVGSLSFLSKGARRLAQRDACGGYNRMMGTWAAVRSVGQSVHRYEAIKDRIDRSTDERQPMRRETRQPMRRETVVATGAVECACARKYESRNSLRPDSAPETAGGVHTGGDRPCAESRLWLRSSHSLDRRPRDTNGRGRSERKRDSGRQRTVSSDRSRPMWFVR